MAGLPERFVGRILLEPVFGCWLWTGLLNRDGYGKFSVGGWKLAHRVAFATLRGYEPKQLDHLCRVRCCVNPAHLEEVDNRTNSLRGVGACARNARKTHCPNGHPLVIGNLRRAAAARGWRGCLTCDHSRKHRKNGALGSLEE